MQSKWVVAANHSAAWVAAANHSAEPVSSCRQSQCRASEYLPPITVQSQWVLTCPQAAAGGQTAEQWTSVWRRFPADCRHETAPTHRCVASTTPTAGSLLYTFIHTLLLLLPHLFNGLSSRTTSVNRYQKGKPSLDLNEARDDGVLGWQWHQLDHKQPHSRQITTPTPHQSIFTGRMLFLTPSQQHQRQKT